jgi:hypothetical protein
MAVLPCSDPWAEPAPPIPLSAAPRRALRLVDEELLGLLGAHEVLTSGQLVRLTGLPERTVQHRVGLLWRAGLLNRVRPPREVGTSPYHCWLTPFGADAIGAPAPEPWGEDLPGTLATAALSELWLAVRDRGEGAGLRLVGWRRLRSGLPYDDPRSGTLRALPAEAGLTVALDRFGGHEVTVLVVARVERVPAARLAAVLARFAGYLTSSCEERCRPVLALLARTARVAEGVLGAAEKLGGAPAARHLDEGATATARRRVAVGVLEPRPTELATGPVWRMPDDRRACRLVEVLAGTTGSTT